MTNRNEIRDAVEAARSEGPESLKAHPTLAGGLERVLATWMLSLRMAEADRFEERLQPVREARSLVPDLDAEGAAENAALEEVKEWYLPRSTNLASRVALARILVRASRYPLGDVSWCVNAGTSAWMEPGPARYRRLKPTRLTTLEHGAEILVLRGDGKCAGCKEPISPRSERIGGGARSLKIRRDYCDNCDEDAWDGESVRELLDLVVPALTAVTERRTTEERIIIIRPATEVLNLQRAALDALAADLQRDGFTVRIIRPAAIAAGSTAKIVEVVGVPDDDEAETHRVSTLAALARLEGPRSSSRSSTPRA